MSTAKSMLVDRARIDRLDDLVSGVAMAMDERDLAAIRVAFNEFLSEWTYVKPFQCHRCGMVHPAAEACR